MLSWEKKRKKKICITFFFLGGGCGDMVSPLSVLKSSPSVRTNNGFRSISFEKISVLDSYFIHW